MPGNESLRNSLEEKAIGVTIDNKLRFAIHLLKVDKNANIKFKKLAIFQK